MSATLLMIAGFGDNASMFDGLCGTVLARSHRLLPLNLPGFGAPARCGETTLAALADDVAEVARAEGATVVVAHSVASIIASLAAALPDSPLATILSLEGNLTAEDAYFSGTAAEFDDPGSFRTAFLARTAGMVRNAPVMGRYRDAVAQADPLALWQLGCDAKRFSHARVPGELLETARRAHYFFNPVNCPQSSLDWLAHSTLPRTVLPGASHWPSVDRPELLSRAMLEVLENA